MKSEIKIILEEGSSNKAKGNCFESLIRNLLALHQYDIRGNINYSGMEIDLVAEHKHNKETLYVECKAKEKVSSDELSKFSFNVGFKKIDKGYFFRTQELESQAGALLSEIKTRPEYKNLTFFEPSEIIKILSDGKMIFEPTSELKNYLISKRTLAVTYFGDFLIYLINESNALPTKFIVINANDNKVQINKEVLQNLKNSILEIQNLEFIELSSNKADYKEKVDINIQIESISEVQESENWYDYLPASSSRNHFVGRDEIRRDVLSFFKEIEDKKTDKHIFYLNGKSGWGKSSLVLEIKGRSQNKHYKNRFFTVAIDTRSANSDNFVALSFNKIIKEAYEQNFIHKSIFTKDLEFTSNVDLLSSESIKELLNLLEVEKKYLVLIFDQFEDVFRKKDFFKTFYKFLSDVTDLKPNLIIGFSWKSDFLIQSDDSSYHIWQQAKEQAKEFTVSEFGEREIDGIIKQLEGSIGIVPKSIKDRIKESSQGLPWLTKKLCIHIYDQIQSGLKREELLESNLNILDLFKKDDERLQSDELRALKLIAKRAYEGNSFEETEVGELIPGNIISSLLHKRLIIRSGAIYNIYWDIYRDYLVTGEIPIIGESYLLRQGVNLCLEVFLLFENDKSESISSLTEKHPKGISQDTLNNILIELRNIGLINKNEENYYAEKDIEISKEGFVEFISTKFSNYTPYIALRKIKKSKIDKEDIIIILKQIFKQEFQDNTWDAYAKNLISWFNLSNLSIKEKLIEPKKGRGGISTLNFNESEKDTFLPRTSIKEMIEILPLFELDESVINSKFNKDLLFLEIIDNTKKLTDFGKKLIQIKDPDETKSILRNKCLEYKKFKILKKTLDSNPKIKVKELVKLMGINFFDGKELSSKVIYATKATSWIKQ
ncbi:Protein of unknown function [Flavobacterium indicum GPTSA100-9 = DSM 17447]|uniref:Uncharacterized protein n=1 Tax=Flavobacterium indicum (strain DSM 17447 / CIP 109464 / GPTSA100-9) TaxID=1094466 RepID=H8XP14_FLAIG|nr:ATP-binding protein [Flavobacterium indicum]CCG52281.1 Protein of unknown function [Flavobacterium indicum GPTSA100-9 = DSM 17447]